MPAPIEWVDEVIRAKTLPQILAITLNSEIVFRAAKIRNFLAAKGVYSPHTERESFRSVPLQPRQPANENLRTVHSFVKSLSKHAIGRVCKVESGRSSTMRSLLWHLAGHRPRTSHHILLTTLNHSFSHLDSGTSRGNAEPIRSTSSMASMRFRRFRRFRWQWRTLFAMLLAITVAPSTNWAQGKKPTSTKVVVGNVIKTRRATTQSFVGTLESIRRSTIGSAVEGRVTEVLFDEGDLVGVAETTNDANDSNRGVPLIEILTSTLDIEIGAAEIQSEIAQQAFDELSISLPQSILSAEANLRQSKSRLEFARSSYDRLNKLNQQSGALSQFELDQARSAYDAARQDLAAFDADYKRLTSTRELQLSQARSRIKSAQQEVARLKDMREKYTVRAPFTGYVTQKMTEVGSWINQGSPVAEIVQLDPIEMIVNVPQEYAQRLQSSFGDNGEQTLTATIKINGFDETVQGTVVGVIPQADLRSRSFPVRIRFDNVPAGKVFAFQPGMLGRASMLIGAEREMTLVKKDALVLGRKTVIYKVVTEKNKEIVYPISIQTGTAIGQWVEVIGMVNPDDRIVLKGNERLKTGAEVEILESRTESLDELMP